MAELRKSPDPLSVVGSRYRVECCIASGIETSIVGAVDCTTGKRVALKCWEGPTSEQEVAALQCFVRSANVTGLFENPHVVEVFGTELGDTISHSVTEWLEGSTLAREVARLGRLPVREALKHILPCVRAVAEAHAVGVIHGDIRPAHIFLCRAKRHTPERARVFDFGRGSPGFHELRLPTRMQVDEFCRYTPPELLSGATLDARSDIYAFGLLLYEVITGERIFVCEDLFDMLREIERGPKRAIGDVTQALPRGLVEVLYRALAVDPSERYQHLATFLDDLTPFATRGDPALDEMFARRELRPEHLASEPRLFHRLPKPADPLAVSAPASAWRELEETLFVPRRWPVWPCALAVAAVFSGSYLALRGDETPERVTTQAAATHAESPSQPQPSESQPEQQPSPPKPEPPPAAVEQAATPTSEAPRRARRHRRPRVQPEPEALTLEIETRLGDSAPVQEVAPPKLELLQLQ
jgi:serine/threonine protein kinase